MENFEFHNPTKIIFGKETICRIGEAINAEKCKRVLLIAGGGSIKKNGVYQKVTDSLRQSGIEWVEAWGVQANPVLSRVRQMIEQARVEQIDAVLAVGGGSVIDSAKSVAAGVHVEDVWQLFEQRFVNVPALPIFTVLTLSAAGSEFDAGAVLSNEEEKKKWFFMAPSLSPKVSIIDPSVQASLPWNQTVNGALDAMAHIMESYFTAGDNEVTLALNESLLRTLVEVTDRLQKDENDYAARSSLAWAAALALSGVQTAGIGFDGASHGIEHGISAVNPDIAHGAGLGVIFPAWIAYCQAANPALFKRWAKNVWGADTVADGLTVFQSKIKQWNSPVTLKELGVEEDQIDEIASKTMEFGLTGTVKKLSQTDIRTILQSATREQQ